MSMSAAVEMLDYLSDNPPAHVILKAVYSDPNARGGRRGRKAMSAIDPEETRAHLAEMQSVCGPALGAAKEMPSHLTELADWAEAEQAKMNSKQK
jgi:hypothetical protein